MYCMKKLLMAVAVLGLVGFATSCKKDCECVTTVGGVETGKVEQSSKLSKDDCEALSSSTTLLEVVTKVECKSK